MAVQDEMLKAGSTQGLTPEEANFLSQGALVGAANMMTAHTSPQAMINKIKSPGGTTEKALATIKTEVYYRYLVMQLIKPVRDHRKLTAAVNLMKIAIDRFL